MSNQKVKEISSAKVCGAFIASGIATTVATLAAILTAVLDSENLLALNTALAIAIVLWFATIMILGCRYVSRRMDRMERRIMKRMASFEDEVLTSVAGNPPQKLRSIR